MPKYIQPPAYQAYMLRIWQEHMAGCDGPAVWRFSLQDTQSGERRGFASLERLMAYIATQIDTEESPLG